MANLNELATRIHNLNAKWWTDMETGKPLERNRGELLMLVITELSEAVEGIRKNLMDDKLPHRRMEEVEMADAYIRILDYAAGFKISPLEGLDVDFFFDDNKAEALLIISRSVSGIWFNTSSVSYVISLIENYCKKFSLDLDGAVEEKLAYNMTREDHTHEARRLANGKKF